MSVLRWTCLLATGFLPFQIATASGDVDPLFGSDEILEVRLEMPLATLKEQRDEDVEFGGKLHYRNELGEAVSVDIKVQARGRYRRRPDTCSIPPMRLNFKTSTVRGTVFENQDKIKLVSHCKSTTRYVQSVLREYLTYQILNTLTDDSYRVRLLSITYVDTDAGSADEIQYGFLIEDKHRFARRTERRVLEMRRTRIADLHPQYTNLISLFHFMIGNTDYSQILGPADDTCCHNHVLFAGQDEPIYSLPYDFDQSGLANAPYASPNPRFNLSSVKQRLYRGRCVNNELLPQTIAHFLDREDRVMQLVTDLEPLTRSSRRQATAFLENFYKVIESEKKTQRSLVRKCL